MQCDSFPGKTKAIVEIIGWNEAFKWNELLAISAPTPKPVNDGLKGRLIINKRDFVAIRSHWWCMWMEM